MERRKNHGLLIRGGRILGKNSPDVRRSLLITDRIIQEIVKDPEEIRGDFRVITLPEAVC